MSGAELRVAELAQGEEAEWDAFVNAASGATVFHLACWRRIIERAFGHPTHYLIARRGAAVTGVLPLTHVKSLLFGSTLVSNAFAMYGGPVAADPASRDALADAALGLMRRLRAPVLELRSMRPQYDGWATRDDLYVTFRRAILPDLDANLMALHSRTRSKIRQTLRRGLRAQLDDDIQQLHRVYAESVRNLGTPVFGKSYFRILKEELGDRCDVVVISDHGTPAAASLNLYFGGEAMPFYFAGTAAARALGANVLMSWEVLRRGWERGCRVYDGGRSKIGTGAYTYKRNWGFEPTPLAYQYRVADGRSIPNRNPLNPKYRPLITAWKRLPLPVANLLGPPLVRRIG